MDLKNYIRDIKDFPTQGIIFKDITPLLKDKDALKYTIILFSEKLKDLDFDYIVAPESRGFIFAPAIAINLGKGFIPVRKKGKLPYQTKEKSYNLEYGTATIEMHIDAISSGDKVVVLDDVLATGGTAKAICELVEEMGGEVSAIASLINLTFLHPEEKLAQYKIISILDY